MASKKRIREQTCFLSMPSDRAQLPVITAVRDTAIELGLTVESLIDRNPAGDKLISAIAVCDVFIADISSISSTLYFELGVAQTMEKRILCLADIDAVNHIPADFDTYHMIIYDRELLEELANSIKDFFLNPVYIREHRQSAVIQNLPFFADWDLLNDRETENLCQELIFQMGFKEVQWSQSGREVDIIAEFSRKDPDGFEFNELWFVSVNTRKATESMLQAALNDTGYFLHRALRHSERTLDFLPSRFQSPVTYLIIDTGKRSHNDMAEIKELIRNHSRKRAESPSIRIRLWDRNYLTSLVQRYSNIGFKYFSSEGRARSETRKTFVELYNENLTLSDRQQKLILELENEKGKRIRAERDAVWKDISFSAAHKIGNPIFAIETGVSLLQKRVIDVDTEGALSVIQIIESSIEKAKAFVEQFKSLSKAQKIDMIPLAVRPLLLDDQKIVESHGINCELICPEDLIIYGDPERLSECFDELCTNAIRWINKKHVEDDDKKIQIIAQKHAGKGLPDFLDSSVSYAVIHFKDNGPGIPVDKKEAIFEPFVTDYEHGTGLGLALVRRIVEGHGGAIIELGEPEKGADFEMYIPISVRQLTK